MDMMQAPILLLGMALLFSLAIERLIEILKALYQHLDASYDFSSTWTTRAERIRDKLEARLDHAKLADQHQMGVVLNLASRYLNDAEEKKNHIQVSADKVRSMGMKVRYKALGILLGLLCAFSLQLDIFALLDMIQAAQKVQPEMITYAPQWYGMLIMGIGMGLGAGPMQKMIAALEGAQQFRQKIKGK